MRILRDWQARDKLANAAKARARPEIVHTVKEGDPKEAG